MITIIYFYYYLMYFSMKVWWKEDNNLRNLINQASAFCSWILSARENWWVKSWKTYSSPRILINEQINIIPETSPRRKYYILSLKRVLHYILVERRLCFCHFMLQNENTSSMGRYLQFFSKNLDFGLPITIDLISHIPNTLFSGRP